MTACVGAAAVDALSVTVARVATPASFAGFAIQADIANQAHRAHVAWHAAYAQSAFHADQVDCARLALIAKDSRSAKFASSANAANPATGKLLLRRPMVCGVGDFGSAWGFLDISLSLPPTGHLLATSDKRTCITPLVTVFTTSRTGIVHPKSHTVASLISSRSNLPRK